MTRPRTFYVYEHRRPDGSLFYVGKGSWTPKKAYGRAASEENRNAIWRRTVIKAGGFTHVVLAEFFAEHDAFAFEAHLIAQHGRRDRGGTLCNLTDGGEGAVGRIVRPETVARFLAAMAHKPRISRPSPMKGRTHTDSAREAISAAASGENNPMHGRKHGAAARAQISAAVRANHPRARPVVDTKSGVLYPSAREAGRQLGFNLNNVKLWLSGRAPNKSTLEYAP